MRAARFSGAFACEGDLVLSATGDPHLSGVTGENFDLWKTVWITFVHIPRDVQPHSAPKLVVVENVAP